MNKSLFIIAIFVLIGFNLPAQSLSSAWKADLKTPVSWQKLTPLGNLIVSTGKGLKGIDTETGKEIWSIDKLANAPAESYEDIEGTPFFSINSSAGKSDYYIIEPFEGNILFSAKDAGLEKVTGKHFLYKSGKIVLIGYEPGSKTPSMMMVEMKIGKKLWSKGNEFGLVSAIKDLGNDEFIVTSAFFAFKMNAATGDEIWKQPLDPRMKAFGNLAAALDKTIGKNFKEEDLVAYIITPEANKDMFIVAAQLKKESEKTDSKGNKTTETSYESQFLGFDLKTGENKWSTPVNFRYPLGVVYAHNNGLLYGAANSGFINVMNYNTGEKLMGKKGNGESVSGTLANVADIGNGKLLLVSKSGKNSSVYILNSSDNQLVFDKPAKIKGDVLYTEILPSGILVGTSEEVNLLNATTGTWHFANAIEGGSRLIASGEKNIYIFNTSDNSIYSLAVNGTSTQKISGEIKFEEKEKPNSMELSGENILLISEQNVASVKQDGVINYNVYYPSPKVRGLKKALLYANAARAAYYGAAFGMYSAAFGSASQGIQVKDANSKMGKEITKGLSQKFGEASVMGMSYTSKFMKMANERFKASTETPEYVIMLSEPEPKKITLIKVDKATGKKISEIDLGKDKEPSYEVDALTGKIYYRDSTNSVTAYNLK